MKKIKLTVGQVSIVDDADFKKFGSIKWTARWSKFTRSFYAVANSACGNGKRRKLLLHREIMGSPRGLFVDHRNHDTLDNRRKNLRSCTRSQNAANRGGLDSNNTSGERGVVLHKCGKWQAQIGMNGKTIYLGLFASKSKAAATYAAANKKNFGMFGGSL